MFGETEYALLDFGDERRLERFGPWILDRPCPAAKGVSKSDPARWHEAHAFFDRDAEEPAWDVRVDMPKYWTIAHASWVLELKLSLLGNVGVFAEQATNWDWIAERVRAWKGAANRPLRVLNLFAYTGGSTLAAAAAGAEVVHLDAVANTVRWGRGNAELSKMEDAPIRWIAEDAMKFVRREVRRGNRYDAVIMDPPTYGHGTKGQIWRLVRHLPKLLASTAEVLSDTPTFFLLTAHTPKFDTTRLREMVAEAFEPLPHGKFQELPLFLTDASGKKLPSGEAVRWWRE